MTGTFKEYWTKTPDWVLMDWLPIRMETSGLRRSSKGISASSIPRRGRSRNVGVSNRTEGVAAPYTIIMGIRGAAEEYPADRHLLQSSNTFCRRG